VDDTTAHGRSRSPSAFGIALVIVGVGALALRLGGIGLFDLAPRWPFLVIVPGVALIVLATLPKPPAGLWLAIAGAIITTVGAVLFYQQSTDTFETWAYAWTLIPAAAGVATLAYGIVSRRRQLVTVGAIVAAGAGALFLAGLWFFEGVLETAGAPIDVAAWGPALLIGIGVLVVVKSLGPRPSRARSVAAADRGSPQEELA